jgi:hypothetical protein
LAGADTIRLPSGIIALSLPAEGRRGDLDITNNLTILGKQVQHPSTGRPVPRPDVCQYHRHISNLTVNNGFVGNGCPRRMLRGEAAGLFRNET